MAKEIINIDNADNAGEDVTVTQQTASTLADSQTLFHYHNGFDVAADVTVSGTRAGDDNFSEAVQLNIENVTAGASGYYIVNEPWEQVQILVSPGADPTAGTFTTHRSDDN